MIAACEENNVKLGVAYYRHFYPVIRRVKEILRAGEIGRPVIAQLKAFERFDPKPADPRQWFLEKKRSGGGPMFDFGCHRLEVLMNLFGPIADTRSLLANVLFSREVEDTALAIFRFESGVQGMLSVSHATSLPEDSLDIYGSEGSIQISVLNEGYLTVRNQAGEVNEANPPHTNLHAPLIKDFSQAILEDCEPQVCGLQGREVARVEADIYEPYC